MAAGPQEYLLSTIHIRNLMHPVGSDKDGPAAQLLELIEQGAEVDVNETLETAMQKLESSPAELLPVTRKTENGPELVGTVYLIDALRAYNHALAETAREEHS